MTMRDTWRAFSLELRDEDAGRLVGFDALGASAAAEVPNGRASAITPAGSEQT